VNELLNDPKSKPVSNVRGKIPAYADCEYLSSGSSEE